MKPEKCYQMQQHNLYHKRKTIVQGLPGSPGGFQ